MGALVQMNDNNLRWGAMHEVTVPCTCSNAEDCRLERYVADVRVLERELVQLRAQVALTLTPGSAVPDRSSIEGALATLAAAGG